jgi:SAM-dependent MidA family methyltransferase
LAEQLARLNEQAPQRAMSLAQQAQRLTMPGEMGERFKAIALTRDFPAPLLGFGRYDQRERLESPA